MGFKTTPIDFLENNPENRKLKVELMNKYEILDEDDIEHPSWDIMMSDYVSQLYCLIQI